MNREIGPPKVRIVQVGRWRYRLTRVDDLWDFGIVYSWGRARAERKARAWIAQRWADRERQAVIEASEWIVE